MVDGAHVVDWDQLVRVVTLRDYNTRVVVFGTAMLGFSSGIIGTFMLLRKRALVGDAISHATLPGVCIAFMLMAAMGGNGKWLPGLLIGAGLFGGLGGLAVVAIRSVSRIKEDAALGIVLSVFFGLGVVLLTVVQRMETGQSAGLQSFIYGKTASMLAADARQIAVLAVLISIACIVLYKELALLCFDQGFAGSQGWPVWLLDVLLMLLVVAVTVIGLQAVGLVLMVAMQIIPAAAARFWTNRLAKMVLISASVGFVSGIVGSGLSALLPNLPAGAVIVLVATSLFVVSMLVGPARGVLPRVVERFGLRRRVARQHVLRAMYEIVEQRVGATVEADGGDMWTTDSSVSVDELLSCRSWSRNRLSGILAMVIREGLCRHRADGRYELTAAGQLDAARVVRNHRLWEIFMTTRADIAPSHVDRDADYIEHVLSPTMIRELERLADGVAVGAQVPASPHPIAAKGH